MTEAAAQPADEAVYDARCTRCPRLAAFLRKTRSAHPDYWARPVPSFGDTAPRILIVGLAPGMHGANRTGRPFTGDHAGILLYESLYAAGLASAPRSTAADDDLTLIDARIGNAVKCVPPENKPLPAEVRTCNAYLTAEIGTLPRVQVFLALGRIAHDAVLLALERPRNAFPFGHGREHALDERRWLIDSYHCSRYNTQTRRLTAEMFREVIAQACVRAGLPGVRPKA
jgi:uracil-DNA glycosylase